MSANPLPEGYGILGTPIYTPPAGLGQLTTPIWTPPDGAGILSTPIYAPPDNQGILATPDYTPADGAGNLATPDFQLPAGYGVLMSKGQDEAQPTGYRQGTFANGNWKGNNIQGNQWAPENPASTPNFAQKYGLPAENSGPPDWIVKGTIKGSYSSGPAPASHNAPSNTGGAIEIRTENTDNVRLDWFHMPDKQE